MKAEVKATYPGLDALASGLSLETPRLLLRQFEERDVDALAAMYADPGMMQFLGTGSTFSRDETWRAISGMLGHWVMRGYGMWAVEERETGFMVGRVGFINPAGWPGFELGWVIDRKRWGRGYAPEAAAVALTYAKDVLRQQRVISLIRPGNAASIRVAEKIGERREGSVQLFDRESLIYASS